MLRQLLVHLGDIYKSSLLDQSELFNKLFYDQFTDASVCDIEIDNSRSQNFVIDFNQAKVYEIFEKYYFKHSYGTKQNSWYGY